MGSKTLIRNISGTVCAVSVFLTAMSPHNSTLVVKGECEFSKANYGFFDENSSNPMKSMNGNIYIQNSSRKLEKEAKELFGNMRDATQEEQQGVTEYLNKISVDTGVNFFNLC